MKKPATSSLRIIGGQWKRRNLSFLTIEGLRPTPDRVRETLFNWLQFDIQGKRCLDAFAGSGALGAEALSRGASLCVFIEKNAAQAQHLQQGLQQLGCTPTVLVGDSLQLLSQQQTPFDVVFLDPPYGLKLWQGACELLVKHQLIDANSLIYIESDCEWSALNLPTQWHCLKNTKAGTVHGFLAQYEF